MYKRQSFHYSDDDTPVLSHVSFEIPAGKSIALVGPSGSGKTVSYTHLDVYKRQDQVDDIMHTFNYPYTIPQALLAEKVCKTIGMDKICLLYTSRCV